MKSVKNKILALGLSAVILPTFLIVIFILNKQSDVGKQIDASVNELTRQNLRQAIEDVYRLCESVYGIIQDKLEDDMRVAEQILTQKGTIALSSYKVEWNAVNQFTKEEKNIKLPKLLIGWRWLGKNRDFTTKTFVVDDVRELVGENCTILQRMNPQGDMLRIASTLENEEGARAIGSYIPAVNPDGKPNPVIQTLLSGQTYYGQAYMVNDRYESVFKPLYDNKGELVGALSLSIKQDQIPSLRKSVLQTRVGQSGYVWVLGGKGTTKGRYIISKDGQSDGKTIIDVKDSDGKFFVREIIKKAVKLSPKDLLYKRYFWKNPDDPAPRSKLAAVKYFEPWDWIIGAGVYEDEFLQVQNHMDMAISHMVNVSVGVGIIISLIMGLIAFVLSKKLADPIRELTVTADRLAEGDVDQEITFVSNDETGLLADSFRAMIDELKQKAKAAEAISEGDLTVEVPLASEKDLLGHSMRKMKQNLEHFIRSAQEMYEKQKAGDYEYMLNPDDFPGSYGQMAQQVNAMVEIYVEVLGKTLDTLRSYGKGDFSTELEKLPGKQIIVNRRVNEIKENIQSLGKEILPLIEAAKEGRLDVRGDASKFEGEYRKIIEGINSTLEALIHPLRIASDYIERIAKGDMPEKIHDEFKGEFDVLRNNLNQCVEAIKSLIADTGELTEAAVQGRLEVRADETRHNGDYRRIIEGINATLDAAVDPVKEVLQVMEKMAEGDLTIRLNGEYHGDHARMKLALNKTLEAFHERSKEIRNAIRQIDNAANQVADSSQSVSHGATEQANSLQEATASVNELNDQAKQNAESANQANQLTGTVQKKAEEGNTRMDEMLHAMDEISESSDQISKIIKVIDEIAFQTNLLALNAAVEAARAGVHGKGFAVVAEEVRNLAQRSAKAAHETTELIERSSERVTRGSEIARKTAEALSSIIEGIGKVSDFIDEMASSSKEQLNAMEQINYALSQIDQITQSNAASAEEGASAAEELASQTRQLKKMMEYFKLKEMQLRESENSFRPKEEKPAEVSDSPSVYPRQPVNRQGAEIVLGEEEFGKL
ncbi:MAG: HAMP domain-containing protein [Calditrichaeota bacterium]|nr:HAMP domain-containing protein [Calditrichota bacterium]